MEANAIYGYAKVGKDATGFFFVISPRDVKNTQIKLGADVDF
jgi:hypothetical protein